MDQFDDFNVDEPQQNNPNTGDTQITNPAYNVVSTVQNNSNVQNQNVNVSQDPNQTGANAYVQSQETRRVPCPNCGQPMVYGSRYCMHCGELDFNNAQNQSIKKLFTRGQRIHRREERRRQRLEKMNKKMYSLDDKGISTQEKVYTGIKKIITLIIIIGIVVAVIYRNAIFKFYETKAKEHYIKQVDTIINTIESKYNPNKCRYEIVDGKMYFYFSDSADYFKVHNSLFTFDHFSGSIQIINAGETYEYVITMYDGKYGIKDVRYKELTIDSIQKMDEPELNASTVTCD